MIASDSTMGNAPIKHPAANIDIVALDVGVNMRGETVIREECRAKRPRYTHGLLWDASDISGTDDFSDMARWGLTAPPVPGVPPREFENLEALRTIQMNPHLFQVNCSLNIACFRELLVDHPN